MQKEADENNSAGIFNSLKEAYGSQARMNNKLLSSDTSEIIAEPLQLVSRWKNYFHGLLNDEAYTNKEVLRTIETFPPRPELEEPPTMHEVEIAINKIKLNKSTGADDIPAEVY